MKKIITCYPPVLAACICLFACSKQTDAPEEKLDSAKLITTISLKDIDPARISAEIKGDTFLFSIPGNLSLSAITPVITFKGTSIQPASGISQEFDNPVKYIVTAQNGSKKEYVVKIVRRKVLYIGGRSIMALDTKDGKLLWQGTERGDYGYSNPLLHNNVLYAGSAGANTNLYAHNSNTGSILWKFTLGAGGIEGPPMIYGNTLYVGCNDSYLYAFDLGTTSEKWRFKTGANVSTQPVNYGRTVIFGSSDGYVYAVDTATASVVWRYPTGGVIGSSSPRLSNGVVFVGDRNGYLHAVDASTGSNKWKYYTGISMEKAEVAVSNGTIYTAGWYSLPIRGGIPGSLYAIDENTGKLNWESLKNLGFSGRLRLNNNIIYVSADDGYFYAVNAANGNVLWRKYILPNGAGAAVADHTVYVGGGGTRYLYALDAITGDEKWKYPIEELLVSYPAVGRKAEDKVKISVGL
ncbi:outer membrane protein assembly factor BamB family protein [Chitinophaga flava]|nr:PQQ-binding-like beta-propeller repeat protein [Chitinophaga flava]